jgi:ATP-dependent helicase/nuclease subunit A
MNLKIISAGAGSGKTYRLTSEMVDLVKKGVRPEGIIATTFTKKAAAELEERVRVRLLESGMPLEADQLTNALIGTVHGLGVKLLQRFAYEAGVSPDASIIADEDQQLFFNQALTTVLTEERVNRMEYLCNRLGFNKNPPQQNGLAAGGTNDLRGRPYQWVWRRRTGAKPGTLHGLFSSFFRGTRWSDR